MADEVKKTYRLYVLKYDADGLAQASKERFSRVNERYVLIYTDKLLDAPEITEAEIWRLNKSELEWLGASNVQLLIEDAQNRREEIKQNLLERIKRLESELEKQQANETPDDIEG